MKEKILSELSDAIRAIEHLTRTEGTHFIERAAQLLAKTFQSGNKVLIAGNGGSLCDAAHFAEELTGYFREKRMALPAIALSEPGHLTCVGNDVGFDRVFARGIEALGQEGDLFIGLSTSGNSPNIVAAFEEAKQRGLVTVAFLGKEGGALKGVADLELIVGGFDTSDRIQEAHMCAIHIMIGMMEEILFDSPSEQTQELVDEVLTL